MTCAKCGSEQLTPTTQWTGNRHDVGYLRCEDCGNVQSTVIIAADAVEPEAAEAPAPSRRRRSADEPTSEAEAAE